MRSKPVAQLLADLGVTKSHSRPHVPDDNPFSESQFKTLKYHPDFPDRFGSQEDARMFCRRFFTWYNEEHYHSGIALLTPSSVHHGQADQVVRARKEVLRSAYADHPERFVRSPPRRRSRPRLCGSILRRHALRIVLRLGFWPPRRPLQAPSTISPDSPTLSMPARRSRRFQIRLSRKEMFSLPKDP